MNCTLCRIYVYIGKATFAINVSNVSQYNCSCYYRIDAILCFETEILLVIRCWYVVLRHLIYLFYLCSVYFILFLPLLLFRTGVCSELMSSYLLQRIFLTWIWNPYRNKNMQKWILWSERSPFRVAGIYLVDWRFGNVLYSHSRDTLLETWSDMKFFHWDISCLSQSLQANTRLMLQVRPRPHPSTRYRIKYWLSLNHSTLHSQICYSYINTVTCGSTVK